MCDKGRNNKIKISVESYHSFINWEPTATKRHKPCICKSTNCK